MKHADRNDLPILRSFYELYAKKPSAVFFANVLTFPWTLYFHIFRLKITSVLYTATLNNLETNPNFNSTVYSFQTPHIQLNLSADVVCSCRDLFVHLRHILATDND
jgi:hypothetical protein